MGDAQHPEEEMIAGAATPFAEAVAAQLFGVVGGYRDAEPARRADLVDRLAALLVRAQNGTPGDEVAQQLLADPVLASSVFQNIDLLYQHGFAGADTVALALLRAMELEKESERDGGP